MAATGTQGSLEQVLTQEVQCTQRLLACLDAERTALASRDLESLEQTIGEKLARTAELEALDRQRGALLAELGFANDAQGVERWFDSLPQADTLKQLWRQLLTNVGACRDANLTNGGVLEAGRQHAEQALCILRGQPDAPGLYKPGGCTDTSLGQRDLGKV